MLFSSSQKRLVCWFKQSNFGQSKYFQEFLFTRLAQLFSLIMILISPSFKLDQQNILFIISYFILLLLNAYFWIVQQQFLFSSLCSLPEILMASFSPHSNAKNNKLSIKQISIKYPKLNHEKDTFFNQDGRQDQVYIQVDVPLPNRVHTEVESQRSKHSIQVEEYQPNLQQTRQRRRKIFESRDSSNINRYSNHKKNKSPASKSKFRQSSFKKIERKEELFENQYEAGPISLNDSENNKMVRNYQAQQIVTLNNINKDHFSNYEYSNRQQVPTFNVEKSQQVNSNTNYSNVNMYDFQSKGNKNKYFLENNNQSRYQQQIKKIKSELRSHQKQLKDLGKKIQYKNLEKEIENSEVIHKIVKKQGQLAKKQEELNQSLQKISLNTLTSSRDTKLLCYELQMQRSRRIEQLSNQNQKLYKELLEAQSYNSKIVQASSPYKNNPIFFGTNSKYFREDCNMKEISALSYRNHMDCQTDGDNTIRQLLSPLEIV